MKKMSLTISNPSFTRQLMKWDREQNTREMPWKGEADPYRIWLSEIILQQTRVEQGLNYYNRFVSEFPDVHKLAAAEDSKVFKLWEGLGYYTRCRNLLATARYISNELKGKFPDSYDEIKALKGIGPYTAAAIASFAYDLPHAVVDGNVYRVLARVFGISIPSDSATGKKYFTELANALLDTKQPGKYNQAIMDLGATICKPLAPNCEACIFQSSCVAFSTGKQNEFPVKEKKTKIRKRWFYYFVLEHRGRFAIQQRNDKDIWQDLYQLPVVEVPAEMEEKEILQIGRKNGWIQRSGESAQISPVYKQQLSHQLIQGRFIYVKKKVRPTPGEDWTWIDRKGRKELAFPRFINQYFLSENLL
jgi:A/G-specific adenine glycosylase